MKTKILKLVAAVAALSLLAGCAVLSVYPFYTPRDLIFDPGLAGRWVKTPSTNEVWQFDDVGGKFYLLTVADDQSTNVIEANLFQLKHYRFLDLLTTNRDELTRFEMPVHLICKVTRSGDTNLSLHFLDYGWLTSLLTTNPGVLRHIVVPEQPGASTNNGNGNMFYLTAETGDLQEFLLEHVDDTNAFSSDSTVELKFVSHR
ncbi:MAG TPA: hypothetical protein VNV43_02165 [Candidatus Acidoferrales bacterium]|jgi:hypothetical protein|nr:hypothetical protein [Candidatus Acidoferrales bacterium]